MSRRKAVADGYKPVRLSPEEVERGAYKRYFGGGADHWDARGGFQLFLLKRVGLEPSQSVLDVGCGPIRGGVHLIRFLDDGRYCGVDYNADFVRAAMQIVDGDPQLAAKRARFAVVEDFDFSKIGGHFDYVLAFSVLNHCDDDQRRAFCEKAPGVLRKTGRVYVTHAHAFDRRIPASSPLEVTRTFDSPEELLPGLRMDRWGWGEGCGVFPILELMLPTEAPKEHDRPGR